MTTKAGKGPLRYTGVKESNPPQIYTSNRDPTVNDFYRYDLGDLWINRSTKHMWALTDKANNQAIWVELGDPWEDISYLTGDMGGAVGPDAADNINLLGDATQGISTTGTPASNQIQWTIADATETQKGVVELATNAEAIAGTVSTNLAIIPSSLSAKLGAQTQYAITYGGGATAALNWLGPLTNGQLVIGSTGAAPVAAALTQPAAGITITGGAGSITFALANDLAALEGLAGTGLATRIAADTWATRSLTAPAAGFTITNPAGIAGNPTFTLADDLAAVEALATTGVVSRTAADTWGTSTITQYAILYGNATEGLTNLGPLTNGQLVIGSTGAAPLANTLASTGGTIAITNAAGSIDLDVGATVATTYTADVGAATPALNNLSILGGGGCNTAGAGATITVTVAGGGFTWNEVVAVAAGMAIDSGYIANNAGLVTLTLPATAALGSMIKVTGKGAGGWRVAQNAGQVIHFANNDTTVGVGGRLDSTGQYDSIELVCITANTDWNVLNSVGAITIT